MMMAWNQDNSSVRGEKWSDSDIFFEDGLNMDVGGVTVTPKFLPEPLEERNYIS